MSRFSLQRYRTPSRSRSRSVTPIHWRKEEARVIKLSEFEKHEADRKYREEKNKERQHSKDRNLDESVSEKDDGTKGEVDYNALDYEDANQTDEEQETTKKVSSLVHYPINLTSNGVQQQQQSVQEEKTEGELVLNKRSDALAMALGVQVKTGEDPPDGEIQISGYKKPTQIENKVEEIREVHTVYSKLAKPTTTEQEQNRNTERNKFNVEKLSNTSYQPFSSNRRRDRFYNNRPMQRFYRRPTRFDRSRRSPPPRRPNRYRSRSRDRHSRRRSRSVERRRSKSLEKHKESEPEKSETEAEKFKRRTEQLLLLKKKMELEMLEMHKKQEESQEKKVCCVIVC